MGLSKMKGQFFVIGALLICSLLFFGLGPGISLTRTETADMQVMSEILNSEIPHALNIGINNTDPLGILYNFTSFSIDNAKKRRMNLTCFWVVFMPAGDDLNVSVGNFLGSEDIFEINVSGNSKELQTGSNSVNSTLFSVTAYKFNVTVHVDDKTERALLLRNKTSIYSDLSLDREGNVVKKEILA